MRVLIVDDEVAARRRLVHMLEDLDVEVVGQASNGLEALELSAERRPDLVLLDISMPEVDGFDVARRLPEPRPVIVFQTAHDEFALEAFEHEAIDYLVKPVRRARLERALERARGRLPESDASALSDAAVAQLRAALTTRSARPRRLLVRHRGGHRLVPLAQIERFRAEEGVVYACLGQAEFLTDYTLRELEERAGMEFVRANRAELVALASVEHYERASDGSARLTLRGGGSVRVARRRATALRQALEEA